MIFRAATPEDLPALIDIQERGAIAGLSHIFPQDRLPFPRASLLERWASEIADPVTHAYVCTDEQGVVTGFAATRKNELLHFGTAVELWGSGTAQELHEAVLNELTNAVAADEGEFGLRVFEENLRARRFYEKLGWVQTGVRTKTSFAPHPVLVEYVRPRDLDTR